MSEWKEYKIGELCEVGRGSSPRPITDPDYFNGGDIPWIKIADATASGKYINKTKEYVNAYGASFSRLLDPNSLILAASGTLGQVNFLGVKGCIHDGWLYLSKYKQELLDKEFLYYFLKTISKEFDNVSYGAAIQNINTGILRNTNIIIPNITTQHRIASILSAYDDLIENNNRRIALLEQTAEQIYKEWFVRMRFPGYENAEFEKGMPKGWEIVSFGSIADFLMGQSPSSEFYNDNGDGLPFHQGVGSYGSRFPIHETFCSVKGRLANEGDILFSVRAPVGRINIANRKLIIGRGIATIRHKNNMQSFLFYLLKHYFQQEDVIGNGAIFNSVGKDELNNFKVLSPFIDIVLKFNNITSVIDEKIKILIHQTQTLKQTRDLLLPRLISGKLKVNDAEKA